MTREHVLLLGNYMPSLTVARSLSAAGLVVIAGDGGEFSTIASSRHCHETWRHPPVRQSEAFLSALDAFLERRPEISLVLPLQERYVSLLSAERRRLPSRLIVPIPEDAVVQTCLDKHRMYEVARDAEVPFAAAIEATDLEDLRTKAEDIGYPCVVRPETSREPLPGERKALICHGPGQLAAALPEWPDGHPALLVQRYVRGPRHNVHFAARNGVILARVQTMTLRTDMADGTGLGVAGISVPSDARLERYCDALIGRLGYTGVGLAQFLVPDVGDPHFLEVNPRHGIALALARDCGLDLARAACELAGRKGIWVVPERFEYPVGRRYAWTSKEINAIRLARRRGETSSIAAMRGLARAIGSAVRANSHATWAWSDPLPTLAIYAQWLPLGRLRRVPLGQRDT